MAFKVLKWLALLVITEERLQTAHVEHVVHLTFAHIDLESVVSLWKALD